MTCKRCKKKVSDADAVICRGYCGASFHAICVNVDVPLRQHLGQYRNNLFWLCDGCSLLFSNAHFRALMSGFDQKISALPDAVQSMQGEIEKLNSNLKALSAKVDGIPITPTPFSSPNPWPAIHRTNRAAQSAKRLRDSDGKSVNVAVDSIKMGTKAATAIPSICLDPRLEDDFVWVYLSAFHPNTTERQVASLVTDCLELATNTKVKVVILVPKGKDLNSLNYVSFKIGLNERFKEKALSCDSWPEHIRFRQFEDNRAKNLPRVVSITSVDHPETATLPTLSLANMDVQEFRDCQDARNDA
ncbi:uncharacterized protein LOC129717333 [Wyeomyia smithii]|uniref:uncharacterized protein LOC129717333 n=1 Tax=Wyeomyia smithii TaxID=174621 RepID=UPI002467FC70|nr:uncharacterized protein LOC129717333 [Wyeomyia smithii]